jgi:hypothetical protein
MPYIYAYPYAYLCLYIYAYPYISVCYIQADFSECLGDHDRLWVGVYCCVAIPCAIYPRSTSYYYKLSFKLASIIATILPLLFAQSALPVVCPLWR